VLDLYYDYEKLLDRWAAAFGEDCVHPRIFGRDTLKAGSVTEDFAAVWGLPGGLDAVGKVNESIAPVAQEFLRRINRHLPVFAGDAPNPDRGALADSVARLYPGGGLRPARAEAEAFCAQFARSNEAVRRRWFPERASLFAQNFDSYPEQADPRDLAVEDALAIAAALWAGAQQRETRLRCDLAVATGQIAELTGTRAQAVAAYGQAASLDPGRPLPRSRLAALEHAAPEAAAPSDNAPEPAPAPWAQDVAAQERTARLRKTLSLNGVRRLLGLAPAPRRR
jgi:hypothetical protein